MIRVFPGKAIPIASNIGTIIVRQLTLATGVEQDVDPREVSAYFRNASQEGLRLDLKTDIFQQRLRVCEITDRGNVVLDLSDSRKQTIAESMNLFEGAKAFLDGNPPPNVCRFAISMLEQAIAVWPNNARAYRYLGEAYGRFGELLEAASSFAEAIRLNPSDARAHSRLATIYLYSDEHERAKELSQRALQIDPNDAMVQGVMGWVHVKLEEYTEGKELLERVVASDPNDMFSLSNLGRALLGLKENDEAKVSLLRAIGIEPNYVPALIFLGDVHVELEEYKAAKEVYQKVLRIDPGSTGVLVDLGTVHLKLHEYRDAKRVCQKAVRAKPRSVAAWSNLGVACSELGESRKAKHAYQKALEIEEDNYAVWVNLGGAHAALGEFAEAIDAFEQAKKHDRQPIEAHLGLGSVYQHLGGAENYEKALSVYEELIAFWPHATAYYNLGEVYLQLGDYEKARNAYRTVAEKEPPDEDNFLRVGVLSLAINDLDEAKRYLKKAKPKFEDPDEIKTCAAFIHWVNAKRHWDNRRWSAASSTFQAALDIFDELPGSEFAAAVKAYQRFIDVEHNLSDAIQQEPVEGIYKYVKRAAGSAANTVVAVDAQHVQLLAGKVHCIEAVEEILSQAIKVLRGKRIDLGHIDQLLEAAKAAFEGQDFKPGLDAVDQLKILKHKISGLNTDNKIPFEVLAKLTLVLLVNVMGGLSIPAVLGFGVSVRDFWRLCMHWQKKREDEVIRIIEGFDEDKDNALKELSHPRYASALRRISDPHSKAVRSPELRLRAKEYLAELRERGRLGSD